MISNHKPTLVMLAHSCHDNCTRRSSSSVSHSGVPYSDVRCNGIAGTVESSGASQSRSTTGSYECRAEERSKRVATRSRSWALRIMPDDVACSVAVIWASGVLAGQIFNTEGNSYMMSRLVG